SAAGRRLDGDRSAGDHRGRCALRRPRRQCDYRRRRTGGGRMSPEAAARTAPAADSAAAIDRAIDAARGALAAAQAPDGHWLFELEADATIPAEYVLMRHYRASQSTPRWKARSASICAASRARMAAGRSITAAPSTSAPA